MVSSGSVVEWRSLFNGCRAFCRAWMLILNIAILPMIFCCCLFAFYPKWDEVLRGRPTLCCVSVGCRLYPFHAWFFDFALLCFDYAFTSLWLTLLWLFLLWLILLWLSLLWLSLPWLILLWLTLLYFCDSIFVTYIVAPIVMPNCRAGILRQHFHYFVKASSLLHSLCTLLWFFY